MLEQLEQLEQLCALRGVSGDESAVAEFITAQIGGLCDWRIDALGSVIVEKKGRARAKNRVMLCAHMDEPGFLITGHTDDGLLRFTSVGDIDSRAVLGKAVLVGDAGLPGAIGAKAVHMVEADERDKPTKLDDLLMDIGCSTREAAEAAVSIGERAVFESAFLRFGAGLIKSRALAGRAGCAALLTLLKDEREHDFTAVFATRHMAGGGAAGAAAHAVAPHIAIALEAAPAADYTGVAPQKQICAVGGGPVLTFADADTLYDTALCRLALERARVLGIAAQTRRGAVGDGLAARIQTARGGVRCASIALPCRSMQTPCPVMSENDLLAATRLLADVAAQAAEL